MVRALNCSGICKRNHGEDNSKSKCARCFTARRMQVRDNEERLSGVVPNQRARRSLLTECKNEMSHTYNRIRKLQNQSMGMSQPRHSVAYMVKVDQWA